LSYDTEAKVGGKIAQLGARLIDSTAKKLAGQFFEQFGAQVSSQTLAGSGN
jgi:carbon monoxide dehydrogenase subunit G